MATRSDNIPRRLVPTSPNAPASVCVDVHEIAAIPASPAGFFGWAPGGALLAQVAETARSAADSDKGWLSENSTLIVGVVGIVVSGFVGPTVTAAWTARRERQGDRRRLEVARRDDLRDVIDEAAVALGGAIAALRPLLRAQLAGEELPKEPRDFLSSLNNLGQRLRLRLTADDEVFLTYDRARQRLLTLSTAVNSKQEFDVAVLQFEQARDEFLDASRVALEAIVADEGDPK